MAVPSLIHTGKHLLRFLPILILLAALTLWFAALPVQAANILVETLGDGAPNTDGDCSLREAIINANNDDHNSVLPTAPGAAAQMTSVSM